MAISKIQRKWTVMIYLAGDNNLSSEMIYAIKEMKRVGKIGFGQAVTVLALFDPARGLPTQAYIIESGDKDNELMGQAHHVSAVIGEKSDGRRSTTFILNPIINPNEDTNIVPFNTGDPEPLFQFISYGFIACPAEHYMVILSGHGSGADEDFLLKDESSRDSLTIPELKEVFTSLKREFPDQTIDILGLDSCLMSMAEVYYELANLEKPDNTQAIQQSAIASCVEISPKTKPNTVGLKNTVNFLIGAEGFELSSGWPYQRILSILAKNPEIDPEQYVRKIVKAYTNYYADYVLSGQSVDLTACDLRNDVAKNLKNSMQNLSAVLRNYLKDKNGKNDILLAHWEAQSYKFDQYTDLYDFCDLLRNRSCDKDVRLACGRVMAAIRPDLFNLESDEDIQETSPVVLEADNIGPTFQFSYGLSIYFPWNRVSEVYKTLDFARGTSWWDFLDEYVRATRREPRNSACLSEESPIKNRVFDPPTDEVSVLLDNRGKDAVGVKYTAPADKYTAPADKGLSYKARSMKNPPIAWCPNDDRVRSKRVVKPARKKK